MKCCIQNTGNECDDAEVHMLRNGGREGLSTSPEALHTGANSVFQLMNLLVLGGVTRIALIGCDGRVGPGGKVHWFGDHPVKTPPSVFEDMVKGFRTAVKPLAALGVRVFNCTPGSAVDAFPKVTLESFLHDPA